MGSEIFGSFLTFDKTISIAPPRLALHAPPTQVLERRKAPRVPLKTSVKIANSREQSGSARLRNLSADGMQIRCHVDVAAMLYPHDARTDNDGHPIVHVTLRLSINRGAKLFNAAAALQHVRASRINPQECLVGLRFVGLSPHARYLLNAFFAHRSNESFPELMREDTA